MTDTEIIKAKKIIHSLHAYCFLTQPTYKQMGCDFCENDFDILNKFIDDNNRQKAEIERLKETPISQDTIDGFKADVIKEFADRLCEGRVSNDPVVIAVKSELKMTEPTKIEHNSLCETETYESR